MTAAALAVMMTGAMADTIDPLHGGCSTCASNGTNTPIFETPGGNIGDFGFSSSPPQSGTLTVVILLPNNDPITLPDITGSNLGSAVAFAQDTNGFGVGLTQWTTGGVQGTNPTLAGFLQNAGSPDNNLLTYLGATQAFDPGATGFNVLTVTIPGTLALGGPGDPLADIFDIDKTLPDGAFIVGFLSTANGVVATANSSALFVTPAAAVPGPEVGSGLPGAAAAGLGLLGLGLYRRKRNMPWSGMTPA